MKSKSINDGVERTFVLILDRGEEAFKSITNFAGARRSPAHRCRRSAPSGLPWEATRAPKI
jgi:hypothetical protein